MSAVWYRARAELRGRWRAMLVLALLVGIMGGTAIAAVAGARRTMSAYPRFVERYRGWDVNISITNNPDAEELLARIEELPMVEASTRSSLFFGSVTVGSRTLAFPDVFLFGEQNRPPGVRTFKVLDGRLSDPAREDEVIAGYVLAERLGLHPGDRMTVELMAEDDEGMLTERVEVTVVGIIATVSAFETLSGDGFPAVFGFTPAFTREHRAFEFPGEAAMNVLLRNGEADADALVAAARAAGVAFDGPPTRASSFTAGVQALNRVPATALWMLAAVLGVGALAVLGQSLLRELSATASDYAVIRALGVSRSGLVMLMGLRALLVGVVGSLVGVGVGIAFSPLTPIGLARIAEPDPGVAFDGLALGFGAGAIAIGVLLAGSVPVWRMSRVDRAQRPASASRIAAAAARAGAPVSATSGIRFAIDGGAGARAVPVRTAMLGAAMATTALVAALSFGSSLGHLLDHPELSGYRWDGAVISFEPSLVDRTEEAVRVLPQVAEAWRGTMFPTLDVDGLVIPAYVHEGVEPSLISGRAARRTDEVVLDPLTLERLGKRVGDRVRLGPGLSDRASVDATVVGTFAVPSLPFQPNENVGQAASLTIEALQAADPGSAYEGVYVRFRPGVDLEEGVAAIRDATRDSGFAAFSRKQAATVRNVGRLSTLPAVLAALVGLMGVATLAHALTLTIRRRRRDLAILKTVGFVRRQIRATVSWQATTILLVALGVGIPLGIAGGRWGWRWFAAYLRVVPVPRAPLVGGLVVAVMGVLLANLIAAGPARVAARSRPAVVLRSE